MTFKYEDEKRKDQGGSSKFKQHNIIFFKIKIKIFSKGKSKLYSSFNG
jgi:hypothetical protein